MIKIRYQLNTDAGTDAASNYMANALHGAIQCFYVLAFFLIVSHIFNWDFLGQNIENEQTCSLQACFYK